MSEEIVLRVKDLYKRYENKVVLRGISFEVRRGEVKVIMGPSGTGKTTLLKCIDMLVKPDSGKIWLKDLELTDPRIDISEARRKIGFVFQEFNLFHHLTAIKNVMIGLTKVKKLPKHEARTIAERSLLKVHIGRELWDKYPAQLSGGQKQRVAIARALAMEPMIMLYDEPTSALDPQLTGEVLEVIKELAEDGMTSLIVTHEVGFASEIADEIMIMMDGKIIEKGDPKNILYNPQREETRRFFNKILRIGGGSR
ncbi:MAG: glutamine ABC transporter ATP-binding protein [Thaumarchaeota archaeon]|nr:MAG: glutamine ABC transporter ATP-binding protein [Nitrososphaerota archaeon]